MAKLTPEQQKQRDKASDLSFEAGGISMLLKSSTKLSPSKRKQLEQRRDTLYAEAKRIRESLPKTDPYGNIK